MYRLLRFTISAIVMLQVRTVVKSIFSVTQADLAARQPESIERDKSGREIGVNKYKILVYTNAICIELTVFAALDEQGTYV